MKISDNFCSKGTGLGDACHYDENEIISVFNY